jgi:hypothetical protein
MYQAWPGAFSGVFAARLRREGWAAVATTTASNAVGECAGFGFDTLPVTLPTCPGGTQLQLRLNAQTTVGGWLAVGVADAASGAPISGWGLPDAARWSGNAIRKPAGWGGGADGVDWELGANGSGGGVDAVSYDLTPLAGTAVVLQVRMCRAHLWSWIAACVSAAKL